MFPAKLSADEMKEAVPLLMTKLFHYRPRTLCFLGKGIWDVFRRQAFQLEAEVQPRIDFPSCKRRRVKDRPGAEPMTVASKYFSSPEDGSQRVPRARNSRNPSFQWGLQPFKIVHAQRGRTSGYDT